MKGIIRKADIALGIILIIMCVAASAAVYGHGSAGTVAVVKVDGKFYGEYDLGKDRVIEIDTESGHNELTVENGKIRMSEADCPDRYCVHQFEKSGGIHTSNQTIVCLPHKISVSVRQGNNDSDEADAVSGQIRTAGEN